MRHTLGPLLAAVLVTGVFAQQPQPGQQPPAASGLILGQVIDAGNGRPVAGAVVRLQGASDRGPVPAAAGGRAGAPAAPPSVITNRDGRFLFRDLPPGTYSATAALPGYTPGGFGRRRPEGPIRPIVLGDGERVLDATIRVWKLAAITGTVTDDVGDPVVGMSVTALRRTTTGGRRRLLSTGKAQTDDRGMFRLSSLTPGDYIVAVPLVVTSVPVSSAVEYSVAAQAGPDAGMAASLRRMESGAPNPSSNGIVVGDQQIQLDPIAALLGGGSFALPAPAGGRLLIFPTAFHGGASSASQAEIVTLSSGETRSGADVRLKPAASTRVSGAVTGLDGPAAGLGVRLVPADIEESGLDSTLETAVTMTDGAGRFTFPAVPAGQYVLRAYRVPVSRAAAAPMEMSMVGGVPNVPFAAMPAAPVGQSFWATQSVTVGGDDLADLQVVLRPGLRVSGRIEFEGAVAPAGQNALPVVTLQTFDGRPFMTAPMTASRPEADGSFATLGYPSGRYWINVPTPGPTWSLKSIQSSGVNLLERPLELDASDVAGVVVTFTNRVAELSGTVSGSTNANDDVTVVVFPADYQAWFANGRYARRTVSTVAGRNGEYQLRLPPAGDYFAVAVINARETDGDVAYYAALARQATRLSVAEGEKKTLALAAVQMR